MRVNSVQKKSVQANAPLLFVFAPRSAQRESGTTVFFLAATLHPVSMSDVPVVEPRKCFADGFLIGYEPLGDVRSPWVLTGVVGDASFLRLLTLLA
ncbi:hypothetical protein B0D95_12905 [Cellvibrio sp. PSBB023]|nr:hypothetical protein B0D95_12905 [Cellvibrio sp. PSBB023]